jgi:hypothetical protein
MKPLPHRYAVRLLRLLEKAAGACVVSGSLAAPVHLEPEIAKEP